jgi:hypothetical protein
VEALRSFRDAGSVVDAAGHRITGHRLQVTPPYRNFGCICIMNPARDRISTMVDHGWTTYLREHQATGKCRSVSNAAGIGEVRENVFPYV